MRRKSGGPLASSLSTAYFRLDEKGIKSETFFLEALRSISQSSDPKNQSMLQSSYLRAEERARKSLYRGISVGYEIAAITRLAIERKRVCMRAERKGRI